MSPEGTSPTPPEPAWVLGVPVHPLTKVDLHDHIAHVVASDRHEVILHVNVHAINLAHEHVWLKQMFRRAYLVFCDGAGVRLGAWLLGGRLPERITYADWMWELAGFAAGRRYRLFLLGAKPGVARDAAARLTERFPGLQVVGSHHGYFERTQGSRENEEVVHMINRVRPHILVVGFGMPLQERWLLENWPRLEANVALTGGAVFDYVSGTLARPPEWMCRIGLEWMGRLIIEPRRLSGRYLLGNPIFLWRVLTTRLGMYRSPDPPS